MSEFKKELQNIIQRFVTNHDSVIFKKTFYLVFLLDILLVLMNKERDWSFFIQRKLKRNIVLLKTFEPINYHNFNSFFWLWLNYSLPRLIPYLYHVVVSYFSKIHHCYSTILHPGKENSWIIHHSNICVIFLFCVFWLIEYRLLANSWYFGRLS